MMCDIQSKMSKHYTAIHLLHSQLIVRCLFLLFDHTAWDIHVESKIYSRWFCFQAHGKPDHPPRTDGISLELASKVIKEQSISFSRKDLLSLHGKL